MPISVRCECGRQLWAKDESLGRKTHCPHCARELLVVPVAATPQTVEVLDEVNVKAAKDFPGELLGEGDLGTSTKAIFSLLLGFFPCTCVSATVGLLLGVFALGDIRRSYGRVGGRGLANAGIAMNGVELVIWLLVLPALVVPAVQGVRELGRRDQCEKNLKQIGLGLHNFSSAHGRFPGPAVLDKQGKPLLSWRVAILPYIGEAALYKQFHLDEPWDSPHNQTLVSRMPAIYACPSEPAAQPPAQGQTNYQVLVGPETIFGSPDGTQIAKITDGTSNTLLVCEATTLVTWTKPVDVPMPPRRPLSGLGSTHPGGFNAVFADGSVHFINLTVAPNVMRSLATKSAGEAIARGAF